MNKKELNWLLQTIKDPATAERFVFAQYRRGRIPFKLMAELPGKEVGSAAPRINSRST